MSFHLFVSSSIFFINVLYFLVYRPLTSMVKFISRYFILFDAILDGIISSIFLSDSLLFDYRITEDFCILILYPSTVLYSLT